MHSALGLITAIVLLVSPLAASVPNAYADLNDVAKALGASTAVRKTAARRGRGFSAARATQCQTLSSCRSTSSRQRLHA